NRRSRFHSIAFILKSRCASTKKGISNSYISIVYLFVTGQHLPGVAVLTLTSHLQLAIAGNRWTNMPWYAIQCLPYLKVGAILYFDDQMLFTLHLDRTDTRVIKFYPRLGGFTGHGLIT